MRDNFFIVAYDQTMNSEKTRLRKSCGARRSIRHKVPKMFKIFENSKILYKDFNDSLYNVL